MTTRPMSQCLACVHFRSPLDSDEPSGSVTCAAFPAGIPEDIWRNRADHRQPFDGDNGIRWESDDGAKFPGWAMTPAGRARTTRI